MDEKEFSCGFLTKPKEPTTHKKRHGAGKIIYDQNGLYIATNN